MSLFLENLTNKLTLRQLPGFLEARLTVQMLNKRMDTPSRKQQGLNIYLPFYSEGLGG